MDCPMCGGRGRYRLPMREESTCGLCNGRGTIIEDKSRTETCRVCGGTSFAYERPAGGAAVKVPCKVCEGWGKVRPLAAPATTVDGPTVMFVKAGKPRTAQL